MSARVATVKSLASIERGRSMRDAIEVVRISALPVSASACVTVLALGAGAAAAPTFMPPARPATSMRSARSIAPDRPRFRFSACGGGAGAGCTAGTPCC